MELNNQFEVDRPIGEAWTVLTDVERIAPCLPGAQLQEVEGDEYRGIVKVKVGPITAQYKGKATFVEKDEAAKRAVLKAEGRDSRGQGNASALITAQLSESGAGRTRVVVQTDLTVTGKVAQFGRGVMADVSEKLMGQFVDNLEAKVLSPDGGAPAAAPAPAPAAGSGTAAPSASAVASEPGAVPTPGAPAGSGPGTMGGTPGTATAAESAAPRPAGGAPSTVSPTDAQSGDNGTPGVRKITPTEPVEPVNLLEATGAPLAKRLGPLLGLVLVLWVLVRMRRHRH